MSLQTQTVKDPMATTTNVGHQDIYLLAMKAQQWKEVTTNVIYNNNGNEINNDTKAYNMKYKITIQEIKRHVRRYVAESDRYLVCRDSSPSWRQRGISTKDEIDIEDQGYRSQTKIMKTYKTERQFKYKNKIVAYMNKISYDRYFKRFLAHKDNSKDGRSSSVKTIKKKAKKLKYYGFIVTDDLLDNDGYEDFQYENAEDMENDYAQIFNGRRAPSRAVLQHLKKYYYYMRQREFRRIQYKTGKNKTIPKTEVFKHLFENWHIMILYSIDPFKIGDEIDDFVTETPNAMSFYYFSCFLLETRPAIFYEYTAYKIRYALEMGGGIKCQPMQCSWIDYTGISDLLLRIFRSGDIFGRGEVYTEFIISKLKKYARYKNIMDKDVIYINNISKPIPLSRLIYYLEYEISEEASGQSSDRKTKRRPYWTYDYYIEYFNNHHRLRTPDKYKLIKEEVLAGRYDTSYVFLVAPRVISFVKYVFNNSQKYAYYFVDKRKFLTKVEKHPYWISLRDEVVRKEPYKYLPIETVYYTMIRMFYEAPEYLDIDEILEFLSNRGRPRSVYHLLYEQQQLKYYFAQEYLPEESEENTTDDEIDMYFANHLQYKRRNRMRMKMQSSANSKIDKRYYNITIPVPFQMDYRAANKKPSIRYRKLREMLLEKYLKLQQYLIPIKPKEVPWYVKYNMYERNLVYYERKRRIRLEQFKGYLEKKAVKISDRLLQTRQIVEGVVPEKYYKFVAAPMPWYCEVELLERINKGKAERRYRILEEIILKHTSLDLPEGVKRMIQRHEEIAQKRKAKLYKMSRSLDIFDFQPPRVKQVPDFKRIHANLKADFEYARKEFVPTKPVDIFPHLNNRYPRRTRSVYRTYPYSPMKSKPYHPPIFNEEDKPKTTAKHYALVQYRKRQMEYKLREQYEKEEEEQIRIMKKYKLAPYVRRALRQSNVVTYYQKVHEYANRLYRFQMEYRQKKAEYYAKMMEIYAKVLHRPFLFDNSGQYGYNDVKRVSRLNYQKQEQERPKERRQDERPPESKKPKQMPPKPQPANKIYHEEQDNDDEDDLHIAYYERMRKFQYNHPGHYSDSSDPADHVNSF